LYVDLGGFGATAPMAPIEALRGMLGSLGVREAPQHLEAAGAAFRTATADLGLLIVLDNAADPAQVRPLLPGAGRHLVLITSRDAMAALEFPHAAPIVRLDPRARGGAWDMWVRRENGSLDDAPAETVAGLAATCGGLPLAVALVGAQLASRRQTSA